MNGFAESKASGSSNQLDGADGLMTWESASVRLALVSRIAADIAGCVERLVLLVPEKARLDEFRLQLNWASRSRRYELDREIGAVETDMRNLETELARVGAVLLEPRSGLIGFPTIVNDRRAFFSWKPGENGLTSWNYLGETERQPVPPSWVKPAKEPRSTKSRSRSSR